MDHHTSNQRIESLDDNSYLKNSEILNSDAQLNNSWIHKPMASGDTVTIEKGWKKYSLFLY